jgi:alcohol dehydrogenase
MRAVVFEGNEQVSVQTVPDPVINAADSAIVEIDKTSICGSDLHFYWGEFGSAAGIRPGHEFIGTVAGVGGDVEKIHVGDRVMVMALYGCGHCPGCKALRPTACRKGWHNFGVTHEVPGGQAEAAEIPHADHVLRKIPAWMTMDQAILMTDVLPTGCFAAHNASIEAGSTVVVIGLGPIGLSAVVNAMQYQPERVLAVDSLPERRARAAALGAAPVDPADGPVVAQIMDLTGGVGADSVIEAIGHQDTIESALFAARVGGTVAVIGVNTNFALPFNAPFIMARNLTIRFCTTDVPLMWDRLFPLVEAGGLDLGDVFTHRLPLSQAPAGYDIFAKRKDGVFKVVFDATR